jgi:hypothetical protein
LLLKNSLLKQDTDDPEGGAGHGGDGHVLAFGPEKKKVAWSRPLPNRSRIKDRRVATCLSNAQSADLLCIRAWKGTESKCFSLAR